MKIIFVVFLICICVIPLIAFSITPYQPPPYDKIVNELMNRTSKRLTKKYNLTLVGINEGMMGCVREMGFRFQILQKMSKNEARTLVINCIQEFLNDINEDEKIRKYLEIYPFDVYHVDIVIFIRPENGGDFVYPDLCFVSCSRGKIRYCTNDPEDLWKYKSEHIETFDEAVKLFNEEQCR